VYTYSGDLPQEFVTIANGKDPVSVTEIVDISSQKDAVTWTRRWSVNDRKMFRFQTTHVPGGQGLGLE
jgi:hypothetical protein